MSYLEGTDYKDYVIYHRNIQSNALPADVTINTLIVSNYTISSILPVLDSELNQASIRPIHTIISYSSVEQEISLLSSEQYDCIIVLLWGSPGEINSRAEFILNKLNSLTKAPIILNNYPGSSLPKLKSNNYLIDLNSMVKGRKNYLDKQMWKFAMQPFKEDFLVDLGIRYASFIKALWGKQKKCLILDCDNTIWNGVLSEEGASLPDSFIKFQKLIVDLQSNGTLIALCTKNNHEDIINFIKKSSMPLSLDKIVCIKANWNDKASNILEIQKELNIQLSSIVFVDDNPFEIERVKSSIKEVTTILLSINEPDNYSNILSKRNFFFKHSLTEEDLKRTSMLRAQYKREEERKQIPSLEEYLNSLNQKINFFKASTENIERLVQLFSRTNQFNMTTRRYTKLEVEEMINEDNTDIYCLSVKDKFSELGIVGIAVIKYQMNTAQIDSFLLSCRALGRNLEHSFLERILELFNSKNVKLVHALIRNSCESKKYHNFYQSFGFVQININTLKLNL